ncbi:hypothetical protein QBC44DRAFT_335101 [Cladorrhinum sp. PSN332]|nr:hypothetical protein QBC44DRAFT_335101 [Cladorrhinum sp. PSN332]
MSPSQAKACFSTLTEVLKEVPTPPPAIMTFALTQTATDPCEVNIPKSLSSAYSSYASVLEKWYSTASDDLSSALKQCPGYETLTEGLDTPTCATAGPGKGGDDDDAATTTSAGPGVPALTTGSGGDATTPPAITPSAGAGAGAGADSQQQQGGNNGNPVEGAASTVNGLSGVAVLMAAFMGAVGVL